MGYFDKEKPEKPKKKKDGWLDYLGMAGDILSLNEEGENLPAFAGRLRDHMDEALHEGGEMYGGPSDPEADRYRHVIGMRNAAMDPEVGIHGAWFGGLGHEFNNIRKAVLGGDISQLGSSASRLGLMQILENSADDVVNNFWGILSSVTNPEALTDDELFKILDRASLPVDIRRPDESAVMIGDKDR